MEKGVKTIQFEMSEPMFKIIIKNLCNFPLRCIYMSDFRAFLHSVFALWELALGSKMCYIPTKYYKVCLESRVSYQYALEYTEQWNMYWVIILIKSAKAYKMFHTFKPMIKCSNATHAKLNQIS